MKSTQFTRLSFVIFLVAAQSCAAVSPQALWEAAKVKAKQAQQSFTSKKIAEATVIVGAGALIGLLAGVYLRRNSQPTLSTVLNPGSNNLYSQLQETFQAELTPCEAELKALKCSTKTSPLQIIGAIYKRNGVVSTLKSEQDLVAAQTYLNTLPGNLPRVLARFLKTPRDKNVVIVHAKGPKTFNNVFPTKVASKK